MVKNMGRAKSVKTMSMSSVDNGGQAKQPIMKKRNRQWAGNGNEPMN